MTVINNTASSEAASSLGEAYHAKIIDTDIDSCKCYMLVDGGPQVFTVACRLSMVNVQLGLEDSN